MIRIIYAAAVLLAAGLSAQAQEQGSGSTGTPASGPGGAGVRSGNITSTGQTVPLPGASKSSGTTSLDRGVQRKDDDIQGSICKGC